MSSQDTVRLNTEEQPEAPSHRIGVIIDGAEVDYSSIERVDISLQENSHDYARVIISGISPLSITDYSNRPIQITVDAAPSDGFTFCGYVTRIDPSHKVTSGKANRSLFQEGHLHCLGASAVMRGKRNKIWNTFRVVDLVSEMARTHNFSYACPDNTPVITRKGQSGESDWEILRNVCISAGLAVNVHGTEIHVWSPYNYIRYGAPYDDLGTPESDLGVSSGARGRILEFTGELGASKSHYGSADSQSLDFIDTSGHLLSAESSQLLGRTGYGTTALSGLTDSLPGNATSYSNALRKLEANRAYSNAYSATVETTGVAGPIPGSAVGVNGFKTEVDGNWLVRGIDMHFNRGHFVSTFNLTRDTRGTEYTGLEVLNSWEAAPASMLKASVWHATRRRGHKYASV
jgi:hypothetical protein